MALTGAKRAKSAPDVPTMAESGFPGFDVVIWFGLVAPAGTPADIIGRLNKEVIRIMGMPDIREKLGAIDFEIATSTPADFGAYIKKEVAQWGQVIKTAGVPQIN
jgi:tripartite-type tricarboxylate transporter receptor subunit TctC